ncbi:SRPBCC family protein [Blastococcus sp. Marseille-P5729]|uniref:SRPBCC family protein n=1 Tax=Blastococcus sp. Marseille-P5729 TaxID=2086582 RepID=UPI000D11169E|nr:SRPBCC family protein [Blastococcus sp. Marseille-P5729]
MKLSDAPTTEAEIEIAASAAFVWEIVADLQTPSLTSPEFKGAEWLDGATAPAVGARFVGRNSHPAIGNWETTSHVIKVDEPRELAYAVTDADEPAAVWRYVITPTDHDTVVLKQIAQIGPGRSGLSLAIDRMPEKEDRIVARRLEEHQQSIRANLEKIKQVAEGGER